ncbi:hypothetical protein ANN_26651 [Periplaneta americana]|uniref:GIY-YIG domain-containing protein n=1 Tax=Periplaneta americana TaxID=6978 RepID=A0ABQ8RYM6_PERAM|nr:hypothetical protein ANN_26651 [Periplaneta americana]
MLQQRNIDAIKAKHCLTSSKRWWKLLEMLVLIQQKKEFKKHPMFHYEKEEERIIELRRQRRSVSHKISRILQKLNIKTIHKPQSKIRSHLRQVKDSQGLRTPGIYKIPCECSEVYIGQTGRTIEDRIKEHKRNLRLYYPEKSAVAQHSIEKEHKILFYHTKVINKSSHYWDSTIKEAIEIKLEKNNFNRDGGLQLSQAWTLALDQLRPSYNQGHEEHGPRTATDSNRRNRTRCPPNFTQESREGRSLRGIIIPGPGLANPPTNPISPETA